MLSLLIVCSFALACSVAGAASAAWLWRRDAAEAPVGPFEAIASATLMTIFFPVAVDWALAPIHGIRCAVVAGAAALGALVGGVYLRRVVWPTGALQRGARTLSDPGRESTLLGWCALVAPLVLWIGFAIWRGTLTPILTHDALSYHLPRAVDVARTGTWRHLPVEDWRLASFPASYEMLLADVVLLTGTDQASSVLGVLGYVSAFIMGCAFAERRWGSGPRAWLAGLLWAGTPLALLHSVGHKNDTLTMVCVVATALWGARWVVRGGTAPLVLMLVGAALGLGIKAAGAFVAPALLLGFAPFGLMRRIRSTFTGVRKIAALAGGSALLLGLTGFVTYVAMWSHRSDVVSVAPIGAEQGFLLNMTPRYGDWSALWKFPALLLLAPFSSSPMEVWVPWRHEYWYWPRYELYFSNFGAALSVLAVSIPFVQLALRGRSGVHEGRRERAAATLCLLLVAALMMPLQYHTDGFFNGMPRYLFFLPLLVVDASVLPALDAVRDARRRAWATSAAMVLAAGVFAKNAIDVALHDRFGPLDYVGSLEGAPGSGPPAFYEVRAALVLDRVAGPRDRVVLDGDFGAWIRPAFGRDLGREVTMLPFDEPARRAAVDAADWVVIDRTAFRTGWGDPLLTDMGRVGRVSSCWVGETTERSASIFNLRRGDPRIARPGGNTGESRTRCGVDPRERDFLKAMLDDKRFAVLSYDSARFQAVFERVQRDGLGHP